MNNIESKMLSWLSIATGYPEAGFRFNGSDSPDFILTNGIGFEVKSGYGNAIVFSHRQWLKLLNLPICYVVVYMGKGEAEEVIPMEELPFGIKMWGKYKIRCEKITDTIPREEYLARLKADSNYQNYRQAIKEVK